MYDFRPQVGGGIPQVPRAKNTQPLTPEMIAKLRSHGSNGFKIEVTEEDLWMASCTHKENNGTPTLVQEGVNEDTGNPIVRCTICGKAFEMVDVDKETVKVATELIIDLLQTAKTLYVDAPEQLIVQYYQMIPLLEKFPDLYEKSKNNFSVYENAMGYAPGGVAGANGFQIMNNLLTNPYGGMYGTGAYPPSPAPVMGYPYPYPTQQVPPSQPYDPRVGSPLMGPATQVAPAPAPAPAQTPGAVPPAPGEVQQTKQFDV